MVSPEQSDINSTVNTHHTVVFVKYDVYLEVEIFQNTLAQFHGRPELVEQMTEELRQLL